MERLVFDITLSHGLADIHLRSGKQEVLAYSFCDEDPLGCMARGLAQLCQRQGSFDVVLETENNGIWLLRFRRDHAALELIVKRETGMGDRDMVCHRPARLRHKGDWRTDCATVLAAFTHLRDEFGEEGYQTRWGRPFPVKEIAAIQSALSGSD